MPDARSRIISTTITCGGFSRLTNSPADSELATIQPRRARLKSSRTRAHSSGPPTDSDYFFVSAQENLAAGLILADRSRLGSGSLLLGGVFTMSALSRSRVRHDQSPTTRYSAALLALAMLLAMLAPTEAASSHHRRAKAAPAAKAGAAADEESATDAPKSGLTGNYAE